MADELTVAVPVRPHMIEVVQAPLLEQQPSAEVTTSLTPEQVEAREAVFRQEAQEQQESQQVAGMLGMWTGTLLLHDLAMEAFSGPEIQEVPKMPRLPKNDENDD